MKFGKVEAGYLCWIYPRNQLLPLPNVERTTLLHRAKLSWLPSDADIVLPAPPQPPPTYHGNNSYFSQIDFP